MKDSFFKKTRFAIFWTAFFSESFLAFYNGLLPFILIKDLAASAFCLSLLMTLKPAVSVFSFYWSSSTHRNSQSLKKSLLFSGLFSYLPFLFYPLLDRVWYLIFASTLFMLFSKASFPAWMEILKINLEKESREKLFSLGAIIGYIEGALLGVFIGPLLDSHPSYWKLLLLLSALLGMSSVWIQWRTPLRRLPVNEKTVPPFTLLRPWKEGLALLRSRKDFAQYQLGSMCNGFGIMLALPALTIFFSDHLQLTHSEMTMGRYIFMAIGYVLFSPLWARAFSRFSIHFLTAIACIGFGLYPLFSMLGHFHHSWIFFALFLYGITQAGSHLIWNLSGTIFAKEKESAPFSAMNILTIGIRGLVAPLMGGLLCQYFSPIPVLILSALICFVGSWQMFKKPMEISEAEKI